MQADIDQEFLEFMNEDGIKMFFPPPRRHELEIIEGNLAFANNLSFIEYVQNPTAVFWFLINYLKMTDQGMIKLFRNQEENVDTVDQIIEDYFQYKHTRIDKNKVILRQNLLSFQKKKLQLTKRIFFEGGKRPATQASKPVVMEEEDLFADIPIKNKKNRLSDEESKRTEDTKMTSSQLFSVDKIEHSLHITTWQCVLHIIDVLENKIQTEAKTDQKEKVEFLYKTFTKAIFYNQIKLNDKIINAQRPMSQELIHEELEHQIMIE